MFEFLLSPSVTSSRGGVTHDESPAAAATTINRDPGGPMFVCGGNAWLHSSSDDEQLSTVTSAKGES